MLLFCEVFLSTLSQFSGSGSVRVGCGDHAATLGSCKLALKLCLARCHLKGCGRPGGGRWAPILADKVACLCMKSLGWISTRTLTLFFLVSRFFLFS